MSHIEGVILDWAGTTVDFGCFAPVNAFLKTFDAAGIEVTVDEAREPMGMLKKDHIRAMLKMPRISSLWEDAYGRSYNEIDVEELYACFEPMLLSSLSEYTDPLPHVIETIEVLRGMGMKIGSTTGYNDKMMRIVCEGAAENGYKPDFWITPDATYSYGRPYPYMIFKNFEALGFTDVRRVIKVGDTSADIREGKSAGVWSAGVIIGSSQMGLSRHEYDNLTFAEKEAVILRTNEAFKNEGADFTMRSIAELPGFINKINSGLSYTLS